MNDSTIAGNKLATAVPDVVIIKTGLLRLSDFVFPRPTYAELLSSMILNDFISLLLITACVSEVFREPGLINAYFTPKFTKYEMSRFEKK